MNTMKTTRVTIAVHWGAATARAFADRAAAERALKQDGLIRLTNGNWARNEHEAEQGEYWTITDATVEQLQTEE